ncbi:hypothetical protein [Gramella sp. AN32]|uniref:Uncharacterized protein n=1 Tax=Christiangramia antarctica TaxID=2058158 RepID=A0ABW5X9Q4_9FLAO|nr:hypothetical protein [Gramella sp. AN32]MCM4156195.1 hypothetical protein [Gramella sp. AN32]
MLKQLENILNTEEEIDQIQSVKELVDEVHKKGTFFSLQLKTLELIRRFNKLYAEVFLQGDDSPSKMNQLVIIANTLERELIFLD